MASWSVSDWIYAIQTCIIGISAIIAIFTIRSAKATSREKATLEIILADNKDEHLDEAYSELIMFLKNSKKYYEIYQERHKEDLDDIGFNENLDLPAIIKKGRDNLSPAQARIFDKMTTVLSRHEFYAIGINSGLLDERLFKRMHCSNFIRLWEQISPAVNQLRAENKKDTIFKDFELLATRWKNNPLSADDIIKANKTKT